MPNSSESRPAEPLRFVLIGPGGAGKGTVAQKLTSSDDHLWLSRSWTTRPQRPGERPEAYVYVDRPTFEAHIARSGFLEWAEFLGQLYGTPVPDPPAGHDVLFEIEIEGARQVLERHADATVILLLPPDEETQAERLRGRGDTEEHVASRVEKGRHEVAQGHEMAHHVVVNDDLERAVVEVLGIVEGLRPATGDAFNPPEE